jgi:CPA2 family monovalent cation:H+ antiporter-2
VLALVLIPAIADALNGARPGRHVAALRAVRPRPLGRVGADARQGRRLRRLHAHRRAPRHPVVLHWVAHTGSRELFRLAVLAIALGVAFGAAMPVRRLLRAGRLLRRHDLERIAAEPARRRRIAAAARRLRGAVLRVRRHAVRPMILLRAPLPCWRRSPSSWSASRSPPGIVRAFRPSEWRRADHFGQPGADRRVSPSSSRAWAFRWRSCPNMGRDLILAGAILSILLNPQTETGRTVTGRTLAGVTTKTGFAACIRWDGAGQVSMTRQELV